MTPRELHGPQGILLGRALHDEPRPPLRRRVPVKDPPRGFIGGVGGEDQASFESGAQAVDRAAIEVIPAGRLNTPAAGGEPHRGRGGDRSFDEVASRVPVHRCPGRSRTIQYPHAPPVSTGQYGAGYASAYATAASLRQPR